MRKKILLPSLTALFLGCGGGLTPGTGEPLSSIINLQDPISFVAAFETGTPISGVDLFSQAGSKEDCSGGGTAETTYNLNISGPTITLKAIYHSCKISLWWGAITYDETIDGTTEIKQTVNGVTQKTSLSLSGDLGLAIACDVKQDTNLDLTGSCKVFDAEGGSFKIPLDQSSFLI